LSNVSKLYRLSLETCPKVRTIDAIAHLPLSFFYLTENDSISDLQPLSTIPSLNELMFSHCGSISDISPLSVLTSLNRLAFFGCDSLRDISPISRLEPIERMYLTSNGSLSDFTPLLNGCLGEGDSLNVKAMQAEDLPESLVDALEEKGVQVLDNTRR
jgi:hypothetical protein